MLHYVICYYISKRALYYVICYDNILHTVAGLMSCALASWTLSWMNSAPSTQKGLANYSLPSQAIYMYPQPAASNHHSKYTPEQCYVSTVTMPLSLPTLPRLFLHHNFDTIPMPYLLSLRETLDLGKPWQQLRTFLTYDLQCHGLLLILSL